MYLRSFFTLLAGVLCLSQVAVAQCPNNNTLSFSPPTNMTPAAPGATVTNLAVWGGEYTTLDAVSGGNYQISTCGTGYDSHLTLIDEASGTILAHNGSGCADDGQLDFTATATATIRVLIDQGGGCGHNATNSTVSITFNGVAPVQWLAFTGEATGSQVALKWETAQEVDVDKFIVERADADGNLIEVAEIAPEGEKGDGASYGWTDMQPLPGSNYYRLKELSLDGQIAYHQQTVEVYVDAFNQLTLRSLYPNPASEIVHFQMASPSSETVAIQLFDLQGKVVYASDLAVPNGNLTTELNVAALPTGTYVLSLTQAGVSVKKRLVIAR
ncbi:MAG: T9SS type A sorting domain-containing protein [Bacteroidota bacterium]